MKIDKVIVGGNATFTEEKTELSDRKKNQRKGNPLSFNAFISFSTESELLAEFIKKFIVHMFPDLHPFFISSSPDSIPVGTDWMNSMQKALSSAKIMFVLASKKSLIRPWINFEIGAAWSRNIPIVFLCYDDLSPESLPLPFAMRQAISLSRDEPERCLVKMVKHLTSALALEPTEETNLNYYSEKLKQYLAKERSTSETVEDGSNE